MRTKYGEIRYDTTDSHKSLKEIFADRYCEYLKSHKKHYLKCAHSKCNQTTCHCYYKEILLQYLCSLAVNTCERTSQKKCKENSSVKLQLETTNVLQNEIVKY